ncbi:MAG TPA: glycosyltransferase, partial [Acidimicrobiia bacterium]|nr:glycosyltransferase [Acidimicrobiia bacterium]
VRGAAGVHATAAAEIPEILEYAPDARVFAVRNSLDAEEIEATPPSPAFWSDRHAVAPGVRVFAFLGRLDPYQKGLDLLLDAWDDVVTPDTPAVLALIGTPWRDTYDDLTGRIGALAAPGSVLLTGALYGQEKYQALAAADVYVQTSRYETSPYSIQEALASGLPAIVTPGTNFDRVVAEYGAGYAVDFSHASIADALRAALAASPEDLHTMATQARRLVHERHSLRRAAARMVDAYAAALAGTPFENDD